MSFDTMVLAGANSALPHGIPGANKMKRGDFVLFDLGVIIEGYCSDITRTVAFGEISEEQTRIYNTVLAGQLQAVEACKPGVTLGAIDNAARSVIADAGYGDFFPHRLGHGLGISVRISRCKSWQRVSIKRRYGLHNRARYLRTKRRWRSY